MTRPLALIGLAAALLVTGAAPADLATGATTTKLAWVKIGKGRFRNYDFLSKTESAKNVDWGVDFIYANNASVSKVRSAMINFFPGWGSTMYARVSNDGGNTYSWVGSGGIKNGFGTCLYGNAYHQRLYAPGGNSFGYDPGWGYFVVATSHIDNNECWGGWSGRSEKAERHFWMFAKWLFNQNAWYSFIDMKNYEPSRVVNGHWWESDGKASLAFYPD